MPSLRIVVAEDDAAIRELLVHHLAREASAARRRSMVHRRCGPCGRHGSGDSRRGLAVVDGFDVVRTLRREGRALPV